MYIYIRAHSRLCACVSMCICMCAHVYVCLLTYVFRLEIILHGRQEVSIQLQCSPLITNSLIMNFSKYRQKTFSCQTFSLSMQKFLGHNVFRYNNSWHTSNQICLTMRASSSDIMLGNVRADSRAKPEVHSRQRPCSYACVAIRSLLWA